MKIACYETMPDGAMEVRKSVFVEEQGFKDEFDETDRRSWHLLMLDDGNPVATCRFFAGDGEGEYIVGRLAVKRSYRGQKIGSSLLEAAEKEIDRLGGQKVSLHSQERAREFYEKQGYRVCSGIELDEGCPHVWMCKELSAE